MTHWYDDIEHIQKGLIRDAKDLHTISDACFMLGLHDPGHRLEEMGNSLYAYDVGLGEVMNNKVSADLRRSQEAAANMISAALAVANREVDDGSD